MQSSQVSAVFFSTMSLTFPSESSSSLVIFQAGESTSFGGPFPVSSPNRNLHIIWLQINPYIVGSGRPGHQSTGKERFQHLPFSWLPTRARNRSWHIQDRRRLSRQTPGWSRSSLAFSSTLMYFYTEIILPWDWPCDWSLKQDGHLPSPELVTRKNSSFFLSLKK